MNFLCVEPHFIIESDLSARRPVCAIFNHNYTVLSNDTFITKLEKNYFLFVAHFLPSALFFYQKCTKWQSEIFASLRNREWMGEKELKEHEGPINQTCLKFPKYPAPRNKTITMPWLCATVSVKQMCVQQMPNIM